MNTTKLKSTLGAIIAFLVAFGPDIVTWLGSLNDAPAWLKGLSKAFGVLIGILTSKEGVLLLNRLAPAPAAGATPVAVVRDPQKGAVGFGPLVAIILGGALSGLCLGAALALLGGCHNVTPDQFLNASVDCAKVNPEASPALAQVESCLFSAVSGNPAGCLAGLITEGHFVVDEVACIVAWEAQQQNSKVALSAASKEDLAARQAAVNWLQTEHISIRNTYKGQ